jgi:hypothetical protein
MLINEKRLDPILDAFAEGAAQKLGQLTVNGIVSAINSLWNGLPQADIEHGPHVSRYAITAYLQNTFFGGFSRRSVEAWALWRLSQMPKAQGAALLEVAAATGSGNIQSTLFELVRYFSENAKNYGV